MSSEQPAGMLARLAGNDALKQDLSTALRAGRLPHSILLVGEAGCGAGFAARCLAADYLYPAGGPHAEAVLRGEDSECLSVRGEGASGQIKVERIRDVREKIQHSALSADAAGRVLFIYGAGSLNGSSANAMLKIMEEPPEGVLFLLTATSAAAVLPTIRSRCAAYTVTPAPQPECAAALRRALPALDARQAPDLACVDDGRIGAARDAGNAPPATAARAAARELCRQATARDTYRAAALLARYEKDKEGAARLLAQTLQAASASLRRPGFDGMDAPTAARLARAAGAAARRMAANGNLRLALTLLAAEAAG